MFPDELQRQLVMSGAKVIITLPELVCVVKDALQLAKLNIPIIVVKTKDEAIPEGTVIFNELSEDIHVNKSCLKEVRRTAQDLCFLPYSSGTTGLPKGVELTNLNITANCEQMNEPLIKCFNDTTGKLFFTYMRVILNNMIYVVDSIECSVSKCVFAGMSFYFCEDHSFAINFRLDV